MKRSLFTLAFAGMALMAAAQDYGQDATVTIWNNATAPHSNCLDEDEVEEEPFRIANTKEAVLYLYRAEPSLSTGTAVVICPGGGYRRLAIDNEGFKMARWFADHGITAAVLKYRMPNCHPEVPLEDAEQALAIMRGQVPGAEGFTARRVGIVGCSAGGHLAAMVSTMGRLRPDFSVLFYPVITGDKGRCHKGSFDRLLGSGRTAEKTEQYSLENRVDSLTPPAILLLSDDDRSVPAISSVRYYAALKEQGTKASMHIYPSGGHGWGMKETFAYGAEWRAALLDWLNTLTTEHAEQTVGTK